MAIGWLALLFTPLWGAVLGAVNAGRLGTPRWQPLAAGTLAVAVSFVPNMFARYPAYWFDLLAYLASAWVLWAAGLRGQRAA